VHSKRLEKGTGFAFSYPTWGSEADEEMKAEAIEKARKILETEDNNV